MSTTLALMLQITAANGAAGVLGGLRKSLTDMGRISKDTAAHFDAMTRSLQRAGTAFAVSAYIGSKMKPGVRAAADLEESMNRVKGNIAQVGDKADDLAAKLAKVRDTGREVSKVMPYSSKEIVNIQGDMLKAGVPLEAVAGSHGAAYSAAGLASISGTDPKDVGDMLARIGKQYNFKPEDYQHAADLLAKGEAASPGSLQELMYSLKQFGSTAALLSVSFKDSVTMAAAMAPLGYEAGTAVNRYMLDSVGLTPKQRESMTELGLANTKDGKWNNLLYKEGKYIGLDAENAMVHKQFGKISDTGAKARLAHDIWGQEGMRAALMVGGEGDLFVGMQKQMDASLGLEERMTVTMNGFNMATKAAAGTVQTLLATAFTPALDKATVLANKVNDIADAGAQGLDNHKQANNWMVGGIATAAVGIAGYGLFNLLKGFGSGAKALKGFLGGGASLAGGIAEGKAIQAATGVTPVFVTNFAQMQSGGGAGTATDLAATAAAASSVPGLLKTVATGAKLLAYSTLPEIAALGAGAAATATAMVAGAGVVGYGIGAAVESLGSYATKGTRMEGWMTEHLGGMMAKIAAYFGSKEAQQALEVNLHLDGEKITQVVTGKINREARRN